MENYLLGYRVHHTFYFSIFQKWEVFFLFLSLSSQTDVTATQSAARSEERRQRIDKDWRGSGGRAETLQ